MKTPDFKTLEEAKSWLRKQVEEGARCPCCTQLAKIYKRRIYSTMARNLIDLYKMSLASPEVEYFHVGNFGALASGGGDFAKFVYWGLVEEQPKDENNKAKRTSGHWKLTNKGTLWVNGLATVQSHVKLYDSRVMGFEGEQITIREALGKNFDYEELMA